MSRSEQKVVQYLNEAHAHEMGLVRVLQSQIAMTPRGSYRTALETHLGETRDHAERVAARADALGRRSDPLTAIVDLAETAVAQTLALGKTPFDLLRGSGGEEKVLKNAKDACATEALEIATYTAIEHLARSVGDEQTEKLAASIRADEEKMLERIMRELPKLTAAVVGADVEDDPSYDVTKTGAADAARATGRPRKRRARPARRRSAARARPARCRASRRPRVRSRAPWRRSPIWRSPATTSSPPRRSSRSSPSSRRSSSRRSTPTSASTRTARRSRAHHHAPRRRAVAGLRRAHRLRAPDRPRQGRRRPDQGRAHLRARPQGPRRRAEGHRARARHRLGTDDRSGGDLPPERPACRARPPRLAALRRDEHAVASPGSSPGVRRSSDRARRISRERASPAASARSRFGWPAVVDSAAAVRPL